MKLFASDYALSSMQPDIGEHDTSHVSDDTDHVHKNARASQQHRIITATMHHRTLQSAKNETFIQALTNQEQAGPFAQRPHQHRMSNYHTAHLFFTHSDIHKCGHFSSCVVVILPAGHQQAGCKPRPSSRRVRCCCALVRCRNCEAQLCADHVRRQGVRPL